VALLLTLTAPSLAATKDAQTGGASPSDPKYAPAAKAKIVNGKAIAPIGAPPEVVAVMRAANRIATMPYRYGGGHASFKDTAYDCSGAISYALRGARLLKAPLDSSSFAGWGKAGAGKWITVYTNPGHAFLVVAGLRFDTGYRGRTSRRQAGASGRGPRWGAPRPTSGFTARHVPGL